MSTVFSTTLLVTLTPVLKTDPATPIAAPGAGPATVTTAQPGRLAAAIARHRTRREGTIVRTPVWRSIIERGAGPERRRCVRKTTSATADERHRGRHDRHEQHVGLEGQVGHLHDRVGDMV